MEREAMKLGQLYVALFAVPKAFARVCRSLC